MDKELQVVPQQLPGQAQPTPVSLNQTGNDNTQIAYVERFEQNVAVFPGAQQTAMPVLDQGTAFNYDCFNLFVLGDEQYEGAYFIVPKDRALTESTSQEMKDLCASLSTEAIAIIKTFPALFCSENRHYSKTDPDHIAFYGYVTDIKVQDNGIKVCFCKLNRLSQQVLIDLSYELGIAGAKSYTELSRTHWAIKRVNLVEVLEKAGYRVFKL